MVPKLCRARSWTRTVLEVSQIEWYQNVVVHIVVASAVLEVSQIEWYQNKTLYNKNHAAVLEVSQIEWYQNCFL